MNSKEKIIKFSVLAILFLLPLVAYMFFASGVDNFLRLPILTESVSEINTLPTLDGSSVSFKGHITVLGFYGDDVEGSRANAFNLAHKIYKKNYQFKDFQVVMLAAEGKEEEVRSLKKKLGEIENPENWRFVFAPAEAIAEVFYSLDSSYSLSDDFSSPYVFIIDKDGHLRGRNKEDKDGELFGFDASNYSEINNKMGDDIKVVLAEYRLALKKNDRHREI